MSLYPINFKVTLNSVNAKGETSLEPVDVGFDPGEGTFAIHLPAWVQNSEVRVGPVIYASTLKDATDSYEAACDEYSRLVLGVTFKPVIVVTTAGRIWSASCFESGQIDIECRRMFTDGHNFYYAGSDGTVSTKFGRIADFPGGTSIVDDTPEVRAKLAELCESVRRASMVISAMHEAADPTAYLLSISYTDPKKPAAEPVQTELPLNTPSPTNPEDEEL